MIKTSKVLRSLLTVGSSPRVREAIPADRAPYDRRSAESARLVADLLKPCDKRIAIKTTGEFMKRLATIISLGLTFLCTSGVLGIARAEDNPEPLPGKTLCIVTAKQKAQDGWTDGQVVGKYNIDTADANDSLFQVIGDRDILAKAKSYKGHSIFYECISGQGIASKRVDQTNYDPKQKIMKIGISDYDKLSKMLRYKLTTEYSNFLNKYGYQIEIVDPHKEDYDITIDITTSFVSTFRIKNADMDAFKAKLPKNLKNTKIAKMLTHFNNVILAYAAIPKNQSTEYIADFILGATMDNITQWLFDDSGQFIGKWQREKRNGSPL